MPAVRRISRDAIVDAAVEVLREGGFSAVNARSVAKKLGCSTQPIYSSFQNMDELKAALRARAIALHTQRVQDSLRAHEGNDEGQKPEKRNYGRRHAHWGTTASPAAAAAPATDDAPAPAAATDDPPAAFFFRVGRGAASASSITP